MDETSPPLAALDIGGTKIGVAVGTAGGQVLASERFPNEPERDPEDLLAEALARLEQLTGEHPTPVALGVACPGPYHLPEGRLLAVPNMPRWQAFPLQQWLDAHSPWNARAMNDANAAALAEYHWGALRGSAVGIFLTMSTGMGAGVVVDGQPLQGERGFAGETGRLRLSPDGPVGFARRGSVEGYLSGPGIVQLARMEALRCTQAGEDTGLQAGEITSERLFALARSGDGAAERIVDEVGERLGQLCALLVDLFDPSAIAVGTIARAHGDLFLATARAVLEREGLEPGAVRLCPSEVEDMGHQQALAVALWATGAEGSC